jgi:hypothetical protein
MPARDVARRDDARRRTQARVADDTVAEREPGRLEPARLRDGADPDHDDVGRDGAAVLEPHAPDPRAALERRNADAELDIDARVGVRGCAEHADLAVQHARHRVR